MRGLLSKEWCVIRKNSASTFVMLLLFTLIGIYSGAYSMFAYVAVFLAIIPANYMAFDETSRWQQFALAMPYSRRTIVSAKYIIMLLFAAAATVITAVGLFIGMKKEGVFSAEIYTIYLTVTLAISLLLPSVAFPFNFKFGTAKGRFIMVIMCCFLAGFLGVWFNTYFDSSAAVHLPELSESAVIPIVLLAAVMICALSWLISVKIYEKRDL